MRTFHTSVTDLRQEFGPGIETFPYECGWADEAIWFVTAEDATLADAAIELRVQLSADGIRWLDSGETASLRGPGATFVRVTHFGGFLRLVGSVTVPDSEAATCVLTVRLALKG